MPVKNLYKLIAICLNKNKTKARLKKILILFNKNYFNKIMISICILHLTPKIMTLNRMKNNPPSKRESKRKNSFYKK